MSTNLIWAGEFGRYQWIQHVLHLLAAFTAGIHMISQVMVGATPKHKCLVTNETNILDYQGSCHYTSLDNETFPCEAYEYDLTDYNSTIVTEWDLVCDRRWMGAVAQSIYMFGCMVAASILGQLADRYGRWKILFPTCVFQLIFAVACGFAPNYATYTVLRFIVAVNTAGSYMVAFVLSLELAPDRHRTIAGFMFAVLFALGIAVVSGWSYVIRDWPLLQTVLGLHSSLLLLSWWVDESPRWLYSQGRFKEAEAIVRKQLEMNGRTDLIPQHGFTPDQLRAALSNHSQDDESTVVDNKDVEGRKTGNHGIVDLFKTPRLRLRTLNIALNWFANSIVYYGLSLNTGALVGNPHLMLFISGIVEVPAYFISIGLINRLGRRPVIAFCLAMGGLACITTTYFPKSTFAWTTSTTCIVMLGKGFISISFAIIYNYTAELFPTVVRSSAVGVGTTAARTSGVLTPLIFLLDSLDPQLPSVLFGLVALAAGFFSLFLPETRNAPLLNTIQEGESFGTGDYVFAGLTKRWSSSQQMILPDGVVSEDPASRLNNRHEPKPSHYRSIVE